ncbi:7247_t:CDS:1 [Dentiscutata heterogama]|uniref:7247_t:CDS:1 n=1 Tax=Dentiscutata heterogama TaxID=1316150 RepID=A0ACA9KHU0_9GLOM|nr:7247_t:CDS:1 [Dentiscutata heterogama]
MNLNNFLLFKNNLDNFLIVVEPWVNGEYRIAFLNNFKFINDLKDYSFEGKHEIKELFYFEYNNGVPSFVFSNCDIFGYKVYFKTKLILEFNSGKVYFYILQQQLNFFEYNITIIKMQIAINQLKTFVDTDIEAVRQKMLNRSITSNYLTNNEEELVKATLKQIVSSSLDILEDDDPNEREYKIQYLFKLKGHKKEKFNFSDWKITNHNLLAKDEQLYFHSLEKQ